MVYRLCFWICFLQTCQVVAGAGAGDTMSTGALIGMIFGIVFFVAVLIITCVLCLKMRSRYLKNKKMAETRYLQQTPGTSTSTETSAGRLQDIPEEDIGIKGIRKSSHRKREDSNIIIKPIETGIYIGLQNSKQNRKTLAKTKTSGVKDETADSFFACTAETDKYGELTNLHEKEPVLHGIDLHKNTESIKNLTDMITEIDKCDKSTQSDEIEPAILEITLQKNARNADNTTEMLSETGKGDESIEPDKGDPALNAFYSQMSTERRDDATDITSETDEREGSTDPGEKQPVLLDTDLQKSRSTDSATDIITETESGFKTADSTESESDDLESENEEDFVQGIPDINREENTDDENREILITRMIKNEYVLRKDVPHLNSMENIFSGYDAAMAYNAKSNKMSKSDEVPNVKYKMRNREVIKSNPFEFTQDDSDLNIKPESSEGSSLEYKSRMNKSEGNLIEADKRTVISRKSSLISRITSKSFEWKFAKDYVSPYAMPEQLKKEKLERAVKMKERKQQLMKLKREEQAKSRQENDKEYAKWKQQKLYSTCQKALYLSSISVSKYY